MKRRNVVILSLFSAVLTLIFTLLVYFGLTRYFSLHMFPTESYIQNYKSLDKANRDRTVVSVFVPDQRSMERVKPTINSLLDQTVRVDEISLTTFYGQQVPSELKKVVVNYSCSKNYNDCTNLIPTLLREHEKNTKIILVFGNVVYDKEMVDKMVEESVKNPDYIISSNECVLVKPMFFNENVTLYDNESDLKKWLSQHYSKIKHVDSGNHYKRLF